jgi:hypothetical protein
MSVYLNDSEIIKIIDDIKFLKNIKEMVVKNMINIPDDIIELIHEYIEKYKLIRENVIKAKSKNPIEIVKDIMHKDFINIHGPEHHYLDGAAFLVAYKNAGGDIELNSALDELAKRTIKMPGAMCGMWGVCGSSVAIGACLSIINGTGPLSDNQFYKDNMEYTSSVINRMSQIGGPRCCKRNAFISLSYAIDFVEKHYGIKLDKDNIKCEFTSFNKECIKERCPFH